MYKFEGRFLAVDQGDVVLFSDFEDDGDMWTGAGPRMIRNRVTFAAPFDRPPMVMVSLSMWDFGHEANIRADVQAEQVGETAFDIVFRTWGDTRVARVRAAWQALGPVGGDAAWDV